MDRGPALINSKMSISKHTKTAHLRKGGQLFTCTHKDTMQHLWTKNPRSKLMP